MKKLVPDPPATLCISPDLSHEEAIRRAEEYLKKALHLAGSLPDPIEERYQIMQSDALLDLRIAKAFLSVALSPSTEAVPV
ncbi:hypothetical protein V0R50_08645 [Pseudomonas sp. 148P]|uniref:Uncharacterized protein n=1 Tax=Pseudomonas ulcerans TaxID=3115852 RepID=A0ABU7HP72_9PSED|nr:MULTISPECIES: hypothetical protein [unclassified Pseudomonas]MEE1920506.1 hypothetical protein [Pseudomonas sp. 147P]MEE1933288.1 hypothetical protein [Pseudomonas sp. 148P]